jgi:hypothetical protein
LPALREPAPQFDDDQAEECFEVRTNDLTGAGIDRHFVRHSTTQAKGGQHATGAGPRKLDLCQG